MAEVLISPGVLARENDQSFLQAQPIQAERARRVQSLVLRDDGGDPSLYLPSVAGQPGV